MVKFWSNGGLLMMNKGYIGATVIESGTDRITIISVQKGIMLVPLVELNHVKKTLAVLVVVSDKTDSKTLRLIEWSKEMYHTYSVVRDTVEDTVDLYCPHCDDFHYDNELIVDIANDCVKCKVTNEEIKTYKTYKNSVSHTEWRTKKGLSVE